MSKAPKSPAQLCSNAPQQKQQQLPEKEVLRYDAPSTLPKNNIDSENGTDNDDKKKPKDQEDDEDDDCPICLELLSSEPACIIKSCGHAFHQECITDALKRENPKCPNCRSSVAGEPQGVCPSGTMTIRYNYRQNCPGFDNGTTVIEIVYAIMGGTQRLYHENPGQHYSSTSRVAYLPNNEEGRQLLVRLKYAWMHGLIFRIGTSLTTGRPNSVVWASIHHKTTLGGGPHGFPDPNYIRNCNDSLNALNVPQADSCGPRYEEQSNTNTSFSLKYDAPEHLVNGALLHRVLERYHPKASRTKRAKIETAAATTTTSVTAAARAQPTTASKPTRSNNNIIQGTCPSGTMTIVRRKDLVCPGFGALTTTIQITYDFPGGVQREYHPHPNVPYPPTHRVAYLPDNAAGRALLQRLKVAFLSGLCFTVGTSLTTGKSDCIVWDSIPHKTCLATKETSCDSDPFGLVLPYSFPDDKYLSTCHAKLDALHIPAADA